MNWEDLEPNVVDLMAAFLAKAAKSIVILHLGPEGTILNANPAFQELFPVWAKHEGLPLTAIMEPCDRTSVDSIPVEIVTYRIMGGMLPGALLRGVRFQEGSGSILIGERLLPASIEALNLLTATTNELARLNRELQKKFRRTERAHHLAESRYQMLIETTAQGVIWFDDRGQMLEANATALQILSKSADGLSSDVWHEVIDEGGAPLAPEDQPVAQAFHTGQPQFGVVIGLGGGPTWIKLDALPQCLPGETIPYQVCTTFIDITEKKRLQEQQQRLEAEFQQAQKMESLGSLAGGVAHDMNNVLGAILGMASANLGMLPAASPAHHAFETIIKAATRGGKMVRSLLAFARKSPVEEKELDLNSLLREVVELLQRTTLSRVSLEQDFSADLLPIRGDASALTHIFMNLCVNAVDAIAGQGTLILRTCNLSQDWIEVVVEDTGCGMPKEVVAKAFDPFFTTKPVGEGTGLGLSMAYNTVKAHRGQIELQSEPGLGTRVIMRFPVCKLSATRTPGIDASEPVHSPHLLKVLVVDDDELMRAALNMQLEALGHTAVTASSGEEALAQLESGLKVDAVVLDMTMAGLGGSGTLPHLRALCPNLPVILASGITNQMVTDLARAHAHVTVLPKPFSLGDLRAYLQSHSRMAQAAIQA